MVSSLKPLRQPKSRGRHQGRASVATARATSLLLFYALFGLIIVVGSVVLILRARASTPPPSNIPVSQAVRPINAPVGQTQDGFWYKGAVDAPVTVIEFGDFQCPSCGVAFQQIEAGIDRDYVETGKIRFIYHDFPLPQHSNAIPAAQAARAAGAQDKFWAMHDLLYSRQSEWEHDRDIAQRLKSYAADLGLDQQAFDQSLDDGQYAAAIQSAIAEAEHQGINATPTYVVDGKTVDASGLRAAINAALHAKGQ